jgi:hypothetical protein
MSDSLRFDIDRRQVRKNVQRFLSGAPYLTVFSARILGVPSVAPRRANLIVENIASMEGCLERLRTQLWGGGSM